MLKAGDCVRCLDSNGYPLTSGANYLVDVGQVDDGAMISLVGYEGAFLASRFELASEPCEDIAVRRKAAIDASVKECLARAGGAAMCIANRAHVLVAALRSHGIVNDVMLERSEHLPERMHGSRLAIESIVDVLGLCAIVERNAGGFDEEQLRFDVRNIVTKTLREIM
jgi:hypothetical protein